MSAARDVTVSVINRVPGQLAAPFRSGSLLARTAAPFLESLLPTEMTEVVVRSGPARGLRLVIDVQHEKYYWTGAYERPVQHAFEAFLRPGNVVWDVGAHIGFFSLLASRLVGSSGAVVAFEPVAENRSRLKKNLSLNAAQNVSVRSEAVAAVRGNALMHARGSSSMWTLIQDEANPTGPIAACVALDDVARDAQPPTLIKVDVEDAEIDVLRGARRLLGEHGPTVLIELHDPADLKDGLAAADGYLARRLSDSHWALDPPHTASGRSLSTSSLG